ncbi:unnamed protein product [Absidia cylindrospora]
MATNKWVPLTKIAHGTAITSFTPTHTIANITAPSPRSRPVTIYSSTYFSSSTESSLANVKRPSTASSDVSTSISNDYAYMLPLEVGDDLYILNKMMLGIEYVDLDLTLQDCLVKHSFTATSPSAQLATNVTVESPIFSDPMARYSLGGYEYGDTLPLLAPTSVPSTTRPSSAASFSRPASGTDFDSNLSSASGETQSHHQRRVPSRPAIFTAMDTEHESHKQQRPSPPPLPMVRFDQSTITGADEPLVDEIAACASEWNCLLYTYLEEKQYGAFNAVRDHINYLFQARRQLLDQALSSEELSRLRKEIIQRMVTMNISLHREMIIRHPEHGFILDVNNTSVATLYYMHWKYTISDQIPVTTLFPQDTTNPPTTDQQGMPPGIAASSSLATQWRQARRKRPTYRYKGGDFHHLFFDLKACVAHICQPGEWTELRFSLYSDNQEKFVTEPFVVHLNYNGMPKNETQIGKIQTLFIDLASQDLNEHLYLVCYMFRLGGMKFVNKEKDHLGLLGHHASTIFGGHHHSNHSHQRPAGSGGGYFDYTSRYDQNHQSSAYPNESTALPSSAHTNLFRRPFGCAVLNIGRFLYQVDPENTTAKGSFSKTVGSPALQQRSTMNTEMMRSPTLPSAAHSSPTGIDLSSPTIGTSNASPFNALSGGSSASGSSSIGSSGGYAGHYYLLPSDHDMRIYSPSSESDFAHLHEDIIRDNTKDLIQSSRAESVCVNLRMFYGQQDEVLMTNAALLQDIPLTARIGFPDVVFPDNERNELYITLDSGDFAHFGRTRNIQVIICARDNFTGDVVEMSVAVGSGTPMTSTWESAIYYHEMKPTWNEMVKVKISDVKVWQRSHVFLVVKHRSRHGGGVSPVHNGVATGGGRGFKSTTSIPAFTRLTAEGNTSTSDKILAIGYMPLFIPPLSHDFVADGTHTLCLYKYDRQLLHPSSYFGVVPWCSQTTAPANIEGQENMLASVRQTHRRNSTIRQITNSSSTSARLGDTGASTKSHNGSHHSFASIIGLQQHQRPLYSSENSQGSELSGGNSGYHNGGASARLHPIRDSLVVSTFLCSTQFTQNTALVKLINWRSIVRHDDDALMASDGESADELLAILDKFTFVGEREVVKFLADVFDALLDILVFRIPDFPEKQDALHDQVIVAITWILSIVQDRRFINFRPVLNVYINQRFYCSDEGDDDNSVVDDDDDGLYSSTANHTDEMINNMNLYGMPVRRQQEGNTSRMDSTNPIFKRDADSSGTYQLYTSYRYRLKHNKKLRQKMTLTETTYNQLLQGLIRLSTNPSDITKAKRLRSSIKGWEYLFLFIRQSREMHRAHEDRAQHELREQMYKRDLQRFFDLATDMMRPDQPSSMIGTQTLVLQHFCEAITQVRCTFSAKEIVDIVSTLVDACSHVTGKLVGFKLGMILSIIKAPIFSDKACCFEFGKQVIGWIRVWLNSYMAVAKEVIFARTMDGRGQNQEDIQQQTRLPRAQWLENLRLSLTITHEILEKLRKVRGMSLSGLSPAAIASSPVSSTATPASTTATPRTRPTSMSTLGDDDLESIVSDVYDEPSLEYGISGGPLDELTKMMLLLVPQLLQAYKDLQRLTTQALQATGSSSGSTTKSEPISSTIPRANKNTDTNMPSSANTARHSLTALRERAGSIRDLPQVAEPSAGTNMAATEQNKTPATPSFPVVLQALATSPTAPFPSIYPFQANATNNAAIMAGSDLATVVTSGLLDLTVVLLDLFHLTPRSQWLYVLQSMAANKDDTPENGGGGPNMTADYICTLCYVCMAILFGDDVYKLAETHGTVEGYDAFIEDPTRERRTWPNNWLNLDVVAYKIILGNVLSPVADVLEMDTFMPRREHQKQDNAGRKEFTSTALGGHGNPNQECDIMMRLWRVVFMTVVRVLASPSLEVETFLPQEQRAVWKLVGNIRGDEGTGILERLWNLTGPRQRPSNLTQEDVRQRQESKDLKMKPQLLDYFDHHNKSIHDVDACATDNTDDDLDDDIEGESTLSPSGDGENADTSTLNNESALSTDEDVSQIHLESMPVLLRPLCSASLTLHDKLRSTTVGIIADLITTHIPKVNNTITGQNLMIGTIDKLVMNHGKGSDEIRVKWVAELQQAFQLRLTTDSDREWGRKVVDSLANLMDLLLQIRSLPIDSVEFMDERINATLKLMKFIQICERQEIYIKYVHQLVDLHLHNSNFVEAALTLRFHSDLLKWDPYNEVDAIPELGYIVESSFSRKKGLYETMIAYLDKGTAWELCIDLCQEIGREYASTVVNYSMCGSVLRQTAEFMENIVTKDRYYSEYFRVSFYGRGFPISTRNQHFIYRGMAWEKMSSFVERMQNRHPNAQLISGKPTTGALLPEDQIRDLETELDGQYMQITAVTPMMNPLATPVLTNPLTSDKIKKYYQFNKVYQFTYSRPVTREEENDDSDTTTTTTTTNSNKSSDRVDRSDDNDDSNSNSNRNSMSPDRSDEPPNLSKQELDFLNLWTEKTIFTSEDTFPAITLRSKIVSIEVKEISPIENAVEAMNNKTHELISLEKNYSAYLTNSHIPCNLNPFSMALNGAVDAPVNGGVTLYKKTFLSPYFLKKNPDMLKWVDQLKSAIDDQVVVIDRCLDTHGQLVSSEMKPFHNNLIELYRKNFTDDIDQLRRRGTTLKATSVTTTEKGKGNSNKTTSRKSSVPQSSLRNLNASTSHPNLSTSAQTDRPGSTFFKDMDKPLTMKSRTNSASSQQQRQSLSSPGGTGHLSSLMSPKSTNYFSIPNFREQQPKFFTGDRLQNTSSTLSTSSAEMTNSNIIDHNQERRHRGNSNTSALSAPSSLIHPNDELYLDKMNGNGKTSILSKSLKKSIRRVRKRKSSYGGIHK